MSAPPTGAPQILSRAFWRGPLAVLFLALLTVGISRSMLFAVLPPIAREIGLNEWMVGLMFAAAAGTFALCSPVWGRQADRVGRVKVIALGLAGFGVTMMLFTVAVAVGLAVALLSTAVPYGIDLQVLRRMPTALFSLLTCLSPIAAALTAWAVRGQELTPLDLAGMLLVIAACAAAVWTGRSPGVAGGGRG